MAFPVLEEHFSGVELDYLLEAFDVTMYLIFMVKVFGCMGACVLSIDS